MSSKINIKQYFEKGVFVIPDYQRGYKWSVKEKNKESSFEFFIKSLLKAYENDLSQYFIEAVTVVQENEKIILVDGQQRTTSLFLLFVALSDHKFVEGKLKYNVREDSHVWLNNQVLTMQRPIKNEDVQDIYYFKEALKQIQKEVEYIKKLEEKKEKSFLNYVKENVELLYNIIPKDKAINTFIALNGLKAVMKDEELIKSDLLIKSSRIHKKNDVDDAEYFGVEWKINEDRGRLARNWDKWLYWWNRKEIREYFGISSTQHPLYYLLVTYWNINGKNDNNKVFSFDHFKNQFIDSVQNAKQHFEGLRKLQKTFEDLYNHYESHNFLGLILKTSSSKEEALCYFLTQKSNNELSLEDYAKWSLVRATHLEIVNNTIEIKDIENNLKEDKIIKVRKAQKAIGLLKEKYVYWDENENDFKDQRKENTFRFLLLLNLLQDNNLNRKFDFSIWGNRSLEHIYPKSKKDCLNFEKDDFLEGSIHSIGNLVLLYKDDNSSFGPKDFADKKNTYFNINTSEKFKSRNLLHTISVFANSEWKEKEIIENKKKTINQLSNYYGIY